MKKFLITIAIILIAIIATLLAAPNFVDWNQYRDELASHAKSIIGRDIKIKGDIKISILPSPVLAIKDVHVANYQRATDANFVSLKSLEIHLALAPLLTRNIQVQHLKLVDPIINFENLKDGTDNFSFPLKKNKSELSNFDNAENRTLEQQTNSKPVVAGFTFQIDSFLIENGLVNYRDNTNGRFEQIGNLDGSFRLASLDGPMDASGTAVFRKIPISFSASIGQIVQERTLPLNLVTTIIPGDVKISFGGTISNIKEKPQIRGKITTNGNSLGTLLSAITGDTGVSKVFAQAFSATANITADKKILELKNFVMEYLGTKGVGSAEIKLGSNIETNVLLSLNKLDCDAIFLTSNEAPKASTSINSPKTSENKPNSLRPTTNPIKKNSTVVDLSFLPETLNANLNLSVASLIYKKSTIKNAKLNASMANKEITISQLSARLPGKSELALFGFINQNKTGPVFEGTVDLLTNNLKGLLKWSGLKVPEFGEKRLKLLNFSSKLKTGTNFIQLSKMKLKLDSTKIQGSTKLIFTTRPSITLGLKIDNLNVDSYFPKSRFQKQSNDKGNQAISAGSNLNKVPDSKSPNKSDANYFSTLNFLNSLDTSLKTSIKSLKINGIQASKINLNASLRNGRLLIKNSSFGNIAGLQGKLSGRLSGLQLAHDLPNPSFKDLKIELRGKSFSRFFRTMGIEPAISFNTLGVVKLNTILNGHINSLNISTNIKMQKGTLNLKGLAQPFQITPKISGNFRFLHSDLKTLLRAFNVSYHPITGKMKEVKLAGKLEASTKKLSLKMLTGKLVGLNLGGFINLDFSSPRPAITAKLSTSNINLNELFPQESLSIFFNGIKNKHAFKGSNTSPLNFKRSWTVFTEQTIKPEELLYIAKSDIGRWSRSPVDLKYLNLFNADVVLKSPQIIFNRLKLDRFRLQGKLQNGYLNIQEAKGKLFGGDLRLSGTLKTKKYQYQTQFTLNGLNIPLALQSFQDQTLASGKLDISGNLRTNGKNVEDFVSRLSGTGSLSANGLEISKRSKNKSALAGITSLIASLNQFASSLGGKRNPQKASLKGTFQIINGIAKFDNTQLTSGIGSGTASGIIDLPNWHLNSKGILNISQNVLMQLLMKEAGPKTIPFQISGLLDQPNVKLDTSKFSNKGIRIPSKIEKKLDKILGNKGIGNVLRQIIPISPPRPTPNQSNSNRSPNPNRAKEKPQQTLKPEDIFKNILRGLSR